MMPQWEQMLTPFGEQYAELVQSIEKYVEGLDEARLRDVIASCAAPSSTNCGWYVYAVAPIVKAIANGELIRREARAGAREAVRL